MVGQVPWLVWADGLGVGEDYEYGRGNMLEAEEAAEVVEG